MVYEYPNSEMWVRWSQGGEEALEQWAQNNRQRWTTITTTTITKSSNGGQQVILKKPDVVTNDQENQLTFVVSFFEDDVRDFVQNDDWSGLVRFLNRKSREQGKNTDWSKVLTKTIKTSSSSNSQSDTKTTSGKTSQDQKVKIWRQVMKQVAADDKLGGQGQGQTKQKLDRVFKKVIEKTKAQIGSRTQGGATQTTVTKNTKGGQGGSTSSTTTTTTTTKLDRPMTKEATFVTKEHPGAAFIKAEREWFQRRRRPMVTTPKPTVQPDASLQKADLHSALEAPTLNFDLPL